MKRFEKNEMKIVVVGLGYVGLSNAVLLAQYNEVIGVDISQERVDALNARKSPIIDAELSEYLAEKDLNLSASTDLKASLPGADYVIVSTPTNYDEETHFFDTSSVTAVIEDIIENEPNTCIVVKSTIPVGFIKDVRERLKTDAVIFSPEFLREGKALYDNLHPSRIIVGEKSRRAEIFADLLSQAAQKSPVSILLTEACEAEAIKLFSNSYLAMRVAFFNELDSFAMAKEMDSFDVITGVSLDARVGSHYNNPSFGYGGYCLPKDTKQLLANYDEIPQNIIKAIVESNVTRTKFIADAVLSKRPKTVGIYRLSMKSGSDNFRQSSVLDVLERLKSEGLEIIIYEPDLKQTAFQDTTIMNNLDLFKKVSDLILTNRLSEDLCDVQNKVFTRDLFGEN